MVRCQGTRRGTPLEFACLIWLLDLLFMLQEFGFSSCYLAFGLCFDLGAQHCICLCPLRTSRTSFGTTYWEIRGAQLTEEIHCLDFCVDIGSIIENLSRMRSRGRGQAVNHAI